MLHEALVLLWCVAATQAAYPKLIHIPDIGLGVEGIAWDAARSRFVFGSLLQGRVLYLREEDVESADGLMGTAQIRTLTSADQLLLTSTAGVEVDQKRNNLWACQRNRSASPGTSAVQGAVSLIDLTSGRVKHNVDLTALSRPGRTMFPNDVAADDDGNAYATDSYNDHVLRITPEGVASRFATNPLWKAERPNQLVLNGIEYANGSLLVGMRSGGRAHIYKVPTKAPSSMARVNITNGDLTSLDGMIFDEDKDLLYVVGRENFLAGFVVTLRSRDNWMTAQIMEKSTVPSSCRTPTTAAFVVSGDNRGLWTICSNGFGQGPYQIQWVDVPLAKESRVKYVLFAELFGDGPVPDVSQ